MGIDLKAQKKHLRKLLKCLILKAIVPTVLSPNREKTLENNKLTLPAISKPCTKPCTFSAFSKKNAFPSHELAHLVEVWPRLSDAIRQKIYDLALDAIKDVEERPSVYQETNTEED